LPLGRRRGGSQQGRCGGNSSSKPSGEGGGRLADGDVYYNAQVRSKFSRLLLLPAPEGVGDEISQATIVAVDAL